MKLVNSDDDFEIDESSQEESDEYNENYSDTENQKPIPKAEPKQVQKPTKTKTKSKTKITKTTASKKDTNSLTETQAKQKISSYMISTNRPYSLINVFDNLHKCISKPTLLRLLDELTAEKILSSKTFGKSTIYFANQENMPVLNSSELEKIDEQIRSLESEIACYEMKTNVSTQELQTVSIELTDEQLQSALAALRDDVDQLSKKTAALAADGRAAVAPGVMDTQKKKFTAYRDAWVLRRRLTQDAVNHIAEGMEKKTKAVHDLVGLDDDSSEGIISPL